MTKLEAKTFAECLLEVVQTNERWNFDTTISMLKMMHHPQVKVQIDVQARDDLRTEVIAMGLDIHPIHPDNEEDDV